MNLMNTLAMTMMTNLLLLVLVKKKSSSRELYQYKYRKILHLVEVLGEKE